MKKQYLKILSILALVSLSLGAVAVPLSGTYTVGSGETYTNLTNAMNAAKTEGISANVIFQLKTGAYISNHNFNNIPGLSASKSITIESKTGNKTDVILSASSSTYVLRMYNIDYVKFRNLTVDQTYGQYAIYLSNNANNISFENCDLKGFNSTSNSTNYSIIYIQSNCKNFTVDKCDFSRGFYGVYATNSNCEGLKIKNSTFTNQYHTCYIQYNNDFEYSGNNVVSSRSYGLQVRYSSGLKIFNNTISSSSYGIYLRQIGSSGQSAQSSIYNNIIGSTSSSYAFYLYGETRNMDIIHNTFYSNNTAVYIRQGVSNVQFKNNLVYSNGCSYALQFDNSNYDNFDSDYNAFGNNSNSCSRPFYYKNNSFSFSDYKDFSGKDANSIYGVPQFVNYPNNLVPENGLFGNIGTPFPGITMDLKGVNRSTSNPDAGALEFNPVKNNDIAILDITSPAAPNCSGGDEIKIRVRNIGGNAITSSSFDYYINNALEGTYNHTTTMAVGSTAELTLGSYAFDGDNDSLRVEVKEVNSTTDGDLNNNVQEFNGIYDPVSGTQTFGQGDSLPGLQAFLDKISFGGICGPVVIKIRNGNYNGDFDIELHNVKGTSATNTITFESESGNPEDVILKPDNNNHWGVFEMENVDHLNIRNLTIDANDVNCNPCIYLNGYCGNLDIENVTFIGDSSNCESIIYIDNFVDGLTMRNSRTSFGEYVFYSYGTGNSKPILVENNVFLEAEYGFEIEDHISCVFRNNRYTSALRDANYFGYFYDNEELIIENNFVKIDSLNGSYAMEAGDYISNQNTSSTIQVTGNYIYGGFNPDAAVYIETYNKSIISNNTFVSDSGDNCIDYYNYGNQATLSNNIFAHYKQKPNGSVISLSDYSIPNVFSSNNYFTTGNLINLDGRTYSTISEWEQTAIEKQPLSVDPMFHGTGGNDFHVCNPALDGKGIIVAGIGPDMDGDLRTGSVLDIGADEFSPAGSDDFLVTDKASLCKGKTILKASPGASSYLWSTGATSSNIEVSQTGVYTVTVTGLCGADGIDSVDVIDEGIEAMFSVAHVFGKSISLYDETKGVGTSYFWDFGDGNTSSEENPSHEYAVFGVYTVKLTVTNECGTSTFEVPVSTFPVSIKTLNAHELKVYPNPTHGNLSIKVENNGSLGNNIRIMDLTGKVIKTVVSESQNSTTIDFADLANGIYLIDMILNDQRKVVRIVKQ